MTRSAHGGPRAKLSAMSREVTIRDDVIRLGQLLQLAGIVDGGSDAKFLLASGIVRVNGELEQRRGRQLVVGDVVAVVPEDGVGGDEVVVAAEATGAP